jgi:valyl-tRNA synthetase
MSGDIIDRVDKLLTIAPEKWHPVDRFQAVTECRAEILRLREQVDTWFESAVKAYSASGWSRELAEEMARETYKRIRGGTG